MADALSRQADDTRAQTAHGETVVSGLRDSLAQGTARLGRPDGEYQDFPHTTADAIYSGCLNAMLAPIMLCVQRMQALGPAPTVYLTGGDANLVARHLPLDCQIVDNLALDGLARITRP